MPMTPDTTNYHAFVPQCLFVLWCIDWNHLTTTKWRFGTLRSSCWLCWCTGQQQRASSFLKKYAFFKRSCRLKPPKDLEKTRYIQSYVNLLSKALFWWVTDILILGYKRPLSLSDLGELPKRECAVKHYKKLQLIFEEEKQRAAQNKREPSLTKSYLKAFWKLMLLGALYRLLGDLLAFVGPVCIEYIVNYAYDVKQNKSYANVTMRRHPLVTVDQFFWNGYTLSVVLFFASILQNTFLQNHHFLVVREGVRLRSAVQGMVYSKVLRLSTLALNNGLLTVGQIMNNMSVDATFLMYFFYFVHYIWAVPVQVSITLAILYIKLGISALIGGLFVVVCAPIMYFLGVWMSRMQKKVLVQSDKRVKKVNEVIQGIRVVKLLAWEEAFVNGVETSRTEEIRCLIPHACLKGLMGVIGMAAPVVGAMLTFVLHPLLTDEPLTAGVALSILALFNLLSGPLQLLTLVSAAVANARNQDKFDTVVNIDGDRGSPETLPLRANFNHGDNDSCRSSSIVSCSSVGITAKSHSRQNSGDSLLDVFENRPSSLTRNATSSELLDVKPLTLMRKSSAPVLSTSEGIEYKRRRHHSGVSTGDIEDVTEDMVFLELRNAVEIFFWQLLLASRHQGTHPEKHQHENSHG
ncbi:hypothetical protein BaRGS_00009702 [Batillaria attramentaria]|uniref:ABC transmembrane type-1 domain-containing protein n=1 Tax=Batillaria attramentaria TaxID=370345 RepID=A0ABD0LIG2_9CAEN